MGRCWACNGGACAAFRQCTQIQAGKLRGNVRSLTTLPRSRALRPRTRNMSIATEIAERSSCCAWLGLCVAWAVRRASSLSLLKVVEGLHPPPAFFLLPYYYCVLRADVLPSGVVQRQRQRQRRAGTRPFTNAVTDDRCLHCRMQSSPCWAHRAHLLRRVDNRRCTCRSQGIRHP